MQAHISDLESIASSTSNDFDSVLGAYDRAGSLVSKVGSVYGNYVSSLNTPDMQEVQTKMAPILSRHRSKCFNIPGLFEKIEQMHDMKDDMLKKGEWTAEQARLAERVSFNCDLIDICTRCKLIRCISPLQRFTFPSLGWVPS